MATGTIQPFQPEATATVAASTVSGAATFPAGDAILVFNASAGIAFVAIGAATSTVAAVPVPAGARQLFAGGPFVTSAAVILSTGTGSVYFTSGNGTSY